ncbi:unnamed protein product [Meloidogyne enterolobii]|uniref:Uncharacterized protein n=1 Tax=Meloidogyne enterolobii TaxID=390850 RepID=A0ACB0Z4R8_MELEN
MGNILSSGWNLEICSYCTSITSTSTNFVNELPTIDPEAEKSLRIPNLLINTDMNTDNINADIRLCPP